MKTFTRLSIAIGLAAGALLPQVVLADTPAPIKPKVMLITMFAPPRRRTGSTVWSSSRKCACRACRPSIR